MEHIVWSPFVKPLKNTRNMIDLLGSVPVLLYNKQPPNLVP